MKEEGTDIGRGRDEEGEGEGEKEGEEGKGAGDSKKGQVEGYNALTTRKLVAYSSAAATQLLQQAGIVRNAHPHTYPLQLLHVQCMYYH